MIPHAELTQLLEDNVTTLYIVVVILDGAVLSSADAFAFSVLVATERALPKDIAWSEVEQFSQTIADRRKVFEEVDSAILQGC